MCSQGGPGDGAGAKMHIEWRKESGESGGKVGQSTSSNPVGVMLYDRYCRGKAAKELQTRGVDNSSLFCGFKYPGPDLMAELAAGVGAPQYGGC